MLGLLLFAVLLLLAGGALLNSAAERRDPLADSLFAVLDRDGLRAALGSLEAQAATDSLALRNGHQLAHALGRRALTRSEGNAAVLGQCLPAFASGCYHGVVEALLQLRGKVNTPELEGMCAAVGGGAGRGPVLECAHGLGHGVLGALAMDIHATLGHCDALTLPGFAVACREGAFMEAITAAVNAEDSPAHAHDSHDDPGRALHLDPVDPYSPCDTYADPYAESCWLFQGFVILRRVGYDAGQALRLCDRAPAGRVDRCYQSVGHQMAGLFQRSDAWLTEQCGKGNPARAHACASGAALALASMDWSGARAKRFCASVPEAWSDSCLATAVGALALVS